MATSSSFSFGSAPCFTGSNYTTWKRRMRNFLWGIDEGLWLIVRDGLLAVNPEEQNAWTAEQRRSAQLNCRAMHILQSAMSPDEADKVEHCESAKEIWTCLEKTYEGTSNIKETRIDLLMHDYEAFAMQSGEGIQDMHSRFTILINHLKGLGKKFPSRELVRKILRSLPKEWLPKRTAIEEAKDLSILSVDELIGSLLSHEYVIQQVEKDEGKRRNSICFNSHAYEYDSASEENNDFEKEFALVSRKFYSMIKYKNERNKQYIYNTGRFNDRNKSVPQDRLLAQQTRDLNAGTKEQEPQACYKCGKNGHIRANCPQTLKAKEPDMVATWSDFGSKLDDEEAYMAFAFNSPSNDEVSSKSGQSEAESTPNLESSMVSVLMCRLFSICNL
ncbi:unnamed protein product [Linum tenue]|uniref:CCHC-type domain-containing protein n=1 Tax=Linum tenue TaxID=586396 RepID=A0AAV0H966_9ROSI|nr:unnamed protein product [Linum tenue]